MAKFLADVRFTYTMLTQHEIEAASLEAAQAQANELAESASDWDWSEAKLTVQDVAVREVAP